jgi:hypothetical protein
MAGDLVNRATMFSRTARVAPEKAVFRPALPMRSVPGLNGAGMTKMTYAEQLKHPSWQRKRLSMLDAAGWACSSCGAKEKTLHVHHRRYIKGRLAWEYEDENFDVLCEDCHADEHDAEEVLKQLLATPFMYPGANLRIAIGLLGGYMRASYDLPEGLDKECERVAGGDLMDLGVVAHTIGISSIATIAEFFSLRTTGSIDHGPVVEELLRRWEAAPKKAEEASSDA